MAAWTETERARIRHLMGRAPIFRDQDPLLESAMDAVLAVADGGSQPDNATQVMIQGWLTEITDLETRMKGLRSQLVALQLGTLQIDPLRALMALRMEARRFVHSIASILSTKPLHDVFSTGDYGNAGDLPGHFYGR